MKKYLFHAESIGGEIRTKEFIREVLGRGRRPPWEEPIIFEVNSSKVFLWPFGAYVILNPTEDSLKRAREIIARYATKTVKPFSEEYLVITDCEEDELGNLLSKAVVFADTRIALVAENFCAIKKKNGVEEIFPVIAYVLAQSVSLARIESYVDRIVEKAEEMVETASKTFPPLSPAIKELVSVMRARFELLDDLMILEKPRIAWEQPELEELYEVLRELYEIEERFEAVDRKLTSVQELGQIVAELAQARRENLLELLIILLIVIELLSTLLKW
ncbi:MAG: hypothetical protein DRJ46_00305 [Thermoprotei archaeon]|nr:MAG: hypothetical protein DRJ46_00305 [Thermoprotei archaeon]